MTSIAEFLNRQVDGNSGSRKRDQIDGDSQVFHVFIAFKAFLVGSLP